MICYPEAFSHTKALPEFFLPEKINIFYFVNIMLNSNFNVVFY